MSKPKDNKRTRKKAVALRYDEKNDDAPRVLAKGQGPIAEKILALAKEHGIPVHEDSDLVEVLAALNLYAEIPPATYVIVAEILAFIYRANDSFKKS